jgi:6-phosphofructokinase
LHSTAHSHHRIIVVEIMGHRSGWLALGAGIAGGADVILIPEIPYDVEHIAEAIRKRSRSGKPFSIVAVAEGRDFAPRVRRPGEPGPGRQETPQKEGTVTPEARRNGWQGAGLGIRRTHT